MKRPFIYTNDIAKTITVVLATSQKLANCSDAARGDSSLTILEGSQMVSINHASLCAQQKGFRYTGVEDLAPSKKCR
jgi:hypothetical protein